MKQSIYRLIALVSFVTTVAAADDLETLAGKWSVKKTNNEGQNVTQTIEVNKAKFIFEILAADRRVLLHAEGELKLEKLGPFNSARFYHIRAGDSADDLRDVDDEYQSVYSLDSDTWTVATNLDKQRDGQKPSLDIYKRAKSTTETK